MTCPLASIALRALTACLLSAVVSAVPSIVWGQEGEKVSRVYVGKWRGVSGKAEAVSTRSQGVAIVTRQFGHKIDEFEFEVAEDGTITGSGKATYWFNVTATGPPLVVPPSATAHLDGGMQTREFKIRGEMKEFGSVILNGTPEEKLILINAGQRQQMGAWNVFGPQPGVVRRGCKPVMKSSQAIAQIDMRLEWEAEKKCGMGCYLQLGKLKTVPETGKRKQPPKINWVVLHTTGGPHADPPCPECNPPTESCVAAKFFQGGKLDSIVQQFLKEKTSIHYIIERDGKVVQMVPEYQVAIHLNEAKGEGRNAGTIGIELINHGNPDPKKKDEFPRDQLDSLMKLLSEILCRYDLDFSAVKGHDYFVKEDIDCPNVPYKGPRRIDPGPWFPWDDVRKVVEERLRQGL